MELTLLAIGVTVVATVLFVALPHVGGPGTMRQFARFVAEFGICVIAACLFYILSRTVGGLHFRVLGDAAMVLAPALLFTALGVLRDRRAVAPGVLAFVLTVLVAVVSATAPQPIPLVVKSAAVVVASLACARAAARSPIEPTRPLRVIAGVSTGYAIYTLLRALAGAVAGWDSIPTLAGLFFLPAMLVGITASVIVGFCSLWLWVARKRVQATRRRPNGTIVVIGEWRLASAAYGQERARELLAELRTAARALDADAVDVPRGVEVVLPSAVTVLSTRVGSDYGWSSDEVALLSEGAATGSVGIPVLRPRSARRSRP